MSQIFSYINVVSDGPVLLGARSDVTGDNGERIELTCEVDSNPQALITWTRRGHTQVRPSYRAISISISISISILKMEIFMPPHMSHNVMKIFPLRFSAPAPS